MATTGAEIANAYIALYTQMPGVQNDIKRALGSSGVQSTVTKSGTSLGALLMGAVGGAAVVAVTRAMGAISRSVDSAIRRVDILNNFPRVMENVGFSAEDAAVAIDKMSDRLLGLPTALQDMANTVQVLAPLTRTLDEATELGLAFNNALLAGGKSLDQQTYAMDAYVQMLATGKVDMMRWRSLVATMPGQMNQLAIAMVGANANQNDLYQAMQDGIVTFDQFNAAVVDLNANGIEGFASFEQQARDSTDGIATAQANLSTAITRNLAKVIDKLRPQIMGAISGLTQFANTMGPLVIEVVQATSAFFGWVDANKEWLSTAAVFLGVIVGITTAVRLATQAKLAWAAAMGGAQLVTYLSASGLTIYNGILKAQALGARVAAAAQWLWNAAMSANPIGIIITAVAALVAALIWFFTETELGREIWANVTEFIGNAVTWLWESVLEPVISAIGAAWDWLYSNVIEPVITGIMIYIGLWAALFTWLYETIVQPVIQAIGAIFEWIYGNVIKPVIDGIVAYVEMWAAIFTWLYENVIKPTFDAVAAAFRWVYENVIRPVVDFINRQIDSVGSTVRDIFGGIAGFIGSAFQSVLGVVRGPINALIDLINGIIRGLNTIKVDIPDWVPMVGGQTFGLNIPTIPRLAAGGLIQATQGGTLAVIGEGRYDEAVVPLSPQVLAQLGGGYDGPRELVIVDADGALIGRMQVEASQVTARGFASASPGALYSALGV